MAAAIKTARNNIIRFDPKRLASIRALAPAHEQLQQQAAAARRQRVKRDLDAARATCARLADRRTPPRRPARTEIVHKTKNDALRPEAPCRVEQSAPQGEATNYYDVQREAIATFVVEMLDREHDQYQKKFDAIQRENHSLQRELDVIHRELDVVHRELADLRAVPS